MGGEEDGVVVGGVEVAVGAVDDVGFGEGGAGLRFELMDGEVVDLGRVGAGLGGRRGLGAVGLGEGCLGKGGLGEEEEKEISHMRVLEVS